MSIPQEKVKNGGVTRVGVTGGCNWWFRPIIPWYNNWRPFLVIALWKVMTFLAVVCSPLPSSYVVYPVFFLNPTTKIILFGCPFPSMVSPGAVRPIQWRHWTNKRHFSQFDQMTKVCALGVVNKWEVCVCGMYRSSGSTIRSAVRPARSSSWNWATFWKCLVRRPTSSSTAYVASSSGGFCAVDCAASAQPRRRRSDTT